MIRSRNKNGSTSINRFTLSPVIFAPESWSWYTLWKRATWHGQNRTTDSSESRFWSRFSSLTTWLLSLESFTRGFPLAEFTRSVQRNTALYAKNIALIICSKRPNVSVCNSQEGIPSNRFQSLNDSDIYALSGKRGCFKMDWSSLIAITWCALGIHLPLLKT